MVSMAKHYGRSAAIAAVVVACFASAAAAQPTARNAGDITLTGGFDFVNAYVFRGLRQDDTRVIMWPFADARVDLYSGAGGVTDVAFHVGSWNSLHTGAAGLAGTAQKLWYESRFYATLALGIGPDLTLGTTYTSYTSPNNSFSTVKELAFKVAAGDSTVPADVALNPYALVAFELGTSPGFGQADGGAAAGTYLELGVAPGWAGSDFSIAFPIKVGLSLDDYYELAGVDHPFGFLSLAATATVPLGRTTSYGTWNVHGGMEFQSLGDTPEAFNRGDQSKVIGSIGVGFSY